MARPLHAFKGGRELLDPLKSIGRLRGRRRGFGDDLRNRDRGRRRMWTVLAMIAMAVGGAGERAADAIEHDVAVGAGREVVW